VEAEMIERRHFKNANARRHTLAEAIDKYSAEEARRSHSPDEASMVEGVDSNELRRTYSVSFGHGWHGRLSGCERCDVHHRGQHPSVGRGFPECLGSRARFWRTDVWGSSPASIRSRRFLNR
jgi:hypothetical protein